MKKSKILVIIIVSLVIHSSTVFLAEGLKSNKLERIFAAPVDNLEIDGKLETKWNSTAVEIVLYEIVDNSNQITIVVKTLYNSTHLFFGIIVPDSTLHTNDYVAIIFKTNPDDELFEQLTPILHMGESHDSKICRPLYNQTFDAYSLQNIIVYDSVYGGTNDAFGKCVFNGTHCSYELAFSLDSGDDIGHDFSLEENSEIDICFNILDDDDIDETFNSYWQIRLSDDVYDFNELYISNNIMPIKLLGILPGLLIGLTIIYRQKKK